MRKRIRRHSLSILCSAAWQRATSLVVATFRYLTCLFLRQLSWPAPLQDVQVARDKASS